MTALSPDGGQPSAPRDDAAPVEPREIPARPGTVSTVFNVMLLTLRRITRGKRLLWCLAVVMFPLLLSILVASQGTTPDRYERFLYPALALLHFGLVMPVVALTFATSFPWPQADEGTLTFWFTSPVWRWAIHLGRYLAHLVVGAFLLPLSVLAIGVPLQSGAPDKADMGGVMWAAIVATLLAYPAYLALFGVMTTAFRRGLAFGIVFLVIENFLAIFQGTVQRLTLIFYVRSHFWPAVPKHARFRNRDLFSAHEPVEPGDAVLVFLAVAVAATLLSLLLVQLIEFRGKQRNP